MVTSDHKFKNPKEPPAELKTENPYLDTSLKNCWGKAKAEIIFKEAKGKTNKFKHPVLPRERPFREHFSTRTDAAGGRAGISV